MTESQVDPTLATLVSVVNAMQERQTDGPGVVLTLSGLVISGQVWPNWQWYEDVEQLCRQAYTPSGDEETDEAPGWTALFSGVGQYVANSRAEERAMRAATDGLAERYQQALAEVDVTAFVHLKDAQVFSAGAGPLPSGGMFWRGRLSDVSGWSFGLLGRS